MSARVTRSSSRATTEVEMPPPSSPAPKRTGPAPPTTPTKKRKTATAESPYVPPTPRTEQAIADSVKAQQEKGEEEGTVLLHPELKFNYLDAKEHLIKSDKRWKSVMDTLPCKPFEGEDNEPFNPFK